MYQRQHLDLSAYFSSWTDDQCFEACSSLVMKRVFDLIGSGLLLLVCSPAFLFIALTIKLTSVGPVIFCQPRIGLNGVIFCCYKFRTMHLAATDLLAEQQTVRGDARITMVGRWLRQFSLDELPQLINVFLGDMSLIGPRPHAPATKAAGKFFIDVVPGYNRRHVVRPGITGLAQVSGCRGPTSQIEQILCRVHFDLLYIETISLRLDLKILWLTLTQEIFSAQAF